MNDIRTILCESCSERITCWCTARDKCGTCTEGLQALFNRHRHRVWCPVRNEERLTDLQAAFGDAYDKLARNQEDWRWFCSGAARYPGKREKLDALSAERGSILCHLGTELNIGGHVGQIERSVDRLIQQWASDGGLERV